LELDGSNNIVARYTHGPGIDEPLIIEKNGVSSFYHADGLGSIAELTDSVGAVAQAYTYSSFGKIESQLDPNFVQPYTYTAREFDTETEQYFYRARFYDHSTGRFLEEDPVNLAAIQLPETAVLKSLRASSLALILRHPSFQQNLHLYVSNNPTTLVDPFGLLRQCPCGAQRHFNLDSFLSCISRNRGPLALLSVGCFASLVYSPNVPLLIITGIPTCGGAITIVGGCAGQSFDCWQRL
jgi:RHS repeat-associated protein